MRLDKFLVSTGKISRSDAGRAARGGKITVNGIVEKHADRHIDPDTDIITLHGERIVYRRYTYILLNKPAGYVSATEDGREATVLTLLPKELQRIGLFPCGRLDKYTLGLMLLTNDGDLSHRLLSPRHHVEKRYAYTCKLPLLPEDIEMLEVGVELDPANGWLVSSTVREHFQDIKDVWLFVYDGEIDLANATTDEVAAIRWMSVEEIRALYDAGELVHTLGYFFEHPKLGGQG